MRGIWPRVAGNAKSSACQLTQWGILSALPFTGRSGLLGPLELTQSENGYFTQADTFNDEEVVVGDLNLDALYQFREENPLNFNVTLYEKYLPGLIRKVRKKEHRTQAV